MDINQEVEYLRSIPMLSKLDSSKLKLLAFTSRLVEYHDGEYLFRKQDPADSAYLIMKGEAEVVSEPEGACAEVDDSPQVVLVRGEGELIGEMAVLSRQGRTASIRARGTLTALRIEGDMFVQLLTSNSDVALDVMRQLSDKLAQAHEANNQLQQQLMTLSAGVN
ncbi:MAG: Crp/Fnr family transcriptional regulator [Halopseudomonas sp.]